MSQNEIFQSVNTSEVLGDDEGATLTAEQRRRLSALDNALRAVSPVPAPPSMSANVMFAARRAHAQSPAPASPNAAQLIFVLAMGGLMLFAIVAALVAAVGPAVLSVAELARQFGRAADVVLAVVRAGAGVMQSALSQPIVWVVVVLAFFAFDAWMGLIGVALAPTVRRVQQAKGER